MVGTEFSFDRFVSGFLSPQFTGRLPGQPADRIGYRRRDGLAVFSISQTVHQPLREFHLLRAAIGHCTGGADPVPFRIFVLLVCGFVLAGVWLLPNLPSAEGIGSVGRFKYRLEARVLKLHQYKHDAQASEHSLGFWFTRSRVGLVLLPLCGATRSKEVSR